MKRLPYIILLALIVLLPLMLILFIHNYASAVPTTESLGLAPLLQKMSLKTSDISNVWEFNTNDHKIVLPLTWSNCNGIIDNQPDVKFLWRRFKKLS